MDISFLFFSSSFPVSRNYLKNSGPNRDSGINLTPFFEKINRFYQKFLIKPLAMQKTTHYIIEVYHSMMPA